MATKVPITQNSPNDSSAGGAGDVPVRHVPVEPVTDDTNFSSRATAAQGVRDFGSLYGAGVKSGEMRTIDRRDPYRRAKVISLVLTGLAVLLAAALGGFYFFVQHEDKFSGALIQIDAAPEGAVVAGGTVNVLVRIRNGEAVDLTNAELTVAYPDGFTYAASTPSPTNEAHNAWQFSRIRSGSTAELRFSGTLEGEVRTVREFRATLSYMPSNFSSEFKSEQPFTITIGDSLFGLNWQAPPRVTSALPSTYTLSFTNNGAEEMSHVRLSVELPKDFIISSQAPAPSSGTATWDFDTVPRGAKEEVTFSGTVTADEGSMRELKALLGYLDDAGTFRSQQESSAIVVVVKPQLFVTLTQGGSAVDSAVAPGATLTYLIKYQNDSQSEVRSLRVTLTLTGDALDWTSLVDVNRGTVAKQTISWDTAAVAALAAVKPGQGGELPISIKLREGTVPKGAKSVNYQVTAQADGTSGEVADAAGSTIKVSSQTITTKVNSKFELRAEGRYYSDEFIPVGAGPVPPTVGQTTRYQLYWYLRNGANQVTDATVSAILPATVTWAGEASVTAGTIRYDETTRTVTWSINK
ncbi:MAG: hypothetical protein V1916_03270, partial [Patescibacteria group bacterium]